MKAGKEDRLARRAAALRDNLKRRKESRNTKKEQEKRTTQDHAETSENPAGS